MVVLKAYEVATTSTFTVIKQTKGLEAILWQEILKVYIKIYFLMSIIISI